MIRYSSVCHRDSTLQKNEHTKMRTLALIVNTAVFSIQREVVFDDLPSSGLRFTYSVLVLLLGFMDIITFILIINDIFVTLST